MFYYLSFLRPPPTQVSPSSGNILITPQIVNDLRTELCSDAHEVFYSWSSSRNRDEQENFKTISRPQKLTVWRESSAYKEIPVPLPTGARDGQIYRLHLTSSNQRSPSSPHMVYLGDERIGEQPIPVISIPILFSSRQVKMSDQDRTMHTMKQGYIERIYHIPSSGDQKIHIHLTEQTSFDLDKKIWDSGIGLSSWIVRLFQHDPATELGDPIRAAQDRLMQNPCNIIELGAGTGLVSIVLGALRADKGLNQGCILTTDLGSAIPLLEYNIAANVEKYHASGMFPNALVLDWDNDTLPKEVAAIQHDLDVILMADVTYNTDSFPSLIRTLSNLTRPDIAHAERSAPRQSPLIILGYKERDSSERTLWSLIQEIGIDLEKVGVVKGAGQEYVEIWIGQIKSAPTPPTH